MKDNLKYIDKLAESKLENVKINPETSWEQMNGRLNIGFTNSANFGIVRQTFLRIYNFISSKVFIISISSIILITGMILFFYNNDEKIPVKENEKEVINVNKLSEKSTKDTTNISEEKISEKKENKIEEKEKINKNVHIKVPVFKKIIKRKKIIVKDTIRKTDTVFIEK